MILELSDVSEVQYKKIMIIGDEWWVVSTRIIDVNWCY